MHYLSSGSSLQQLLLSIRRRQITVLQTNLIKFVTFLTRVSCHCNVYTIRYQNVRHFTRKFYTPIKIIIGINAVKISHEGLTLAHSNERSHHKILYKRKLLTCLVCRHCNVVSLKAPQRHEFVYETI